jgi:carbonic anhydrase
VGSIYSLFLGGSERLHFISKDKNGKWLVLQIKNRDNTENSSSSAIRNGTQIQKWFRSFSKKGGTNWDNLPELMQGYDLSESDFVAFVETYLKEEKARLNQ